MTTARRGALAATLVLSVAYLVIGLQPRPPQALGDVPDVVQHALAYAFLAVTTAEGAAALGPARAVVVAVAYALGHGALLEALQSLTLTRRAEARDLLADGIGATLGALSWWLLRGRS